MDNSTNKKRRIIVVGTLVFGAIGLVIGALFSIAGAGMYGSPFQGGSYFNKTLVLVLVFGPFAILPCAILDIWKSGWGGLTLCLASVTDVCVIILNNWSEYGFDVYNSATASTLVALPIFIAGSLLYFSGRPNRSWNVWIWRGSLALLIVTLCFFGCRILPDHWFFMARLLEGDRNPPEI